MMLSLLRLLIFGSVGVCAAFLTGQLSAHSVPDTQSYVEYPWDSWEAALASIRTPGYPLWLSTIRSSLGVEWTPLLQVLLHCVASWRLGEVLWKHVKLPLSASLAAGFAVLLGCTAMDHVGTLATDAPAASFGVLTGSALLSLCASGRISSGVQVILFGLSAIAFRPAYLFLVPWILLAGPLLWRQFRCREKSDHSGAWWSSPLAASMILLVVFGWMTLRWCIVGEFAVVPFGHQNLSAVTVQLVSDDSLQQLTGDGGELAKEVVRRRNLQQFESVQDSSLSTMKIEEQWDPMNYHVIIPAAFELESQTAEAPLTAPTSVRVHARIADMNRQIISRHPKAYLRWIVLGWRRAAWGIAANLAMHPLFLLLALVATLYGFGKIVFTDVSRLRWVPLPQGIGILFLFAASYAAMKLALVILTSPPIGRFADAAAIFIPAVGTAIMINLFAFEWHRWRQSRSPST